MQVHLFGVGGGTEFRHSIVWRRAVQIWPEHGCLRWHGDLAGEPAQGQLAEYRADSELLRSLDFAGGAARSQTFGPAFTESVRAGSRCPRGRLDVQIAGGSLSERLTRSSSASTAVYPQFMRLRRLARLVRNIVHSRTSGCSEDEEYRADLSQSEPLATPKWYRIRTAGVQMNPSAA